MSKILVLNRIACTQGGVFGVLIDNIIPFAVSLEPQWLVNKSDVSCIPPAPGQVVYYICKRVLSPNFGTTFEVCGVLDRHSILFHWGNVIEHTEGCILVAEEFGSLGEDLAILTSRVHPNKGFNEFMHRFGNESEFILKVFWS